MNAFLKTTLSVFIILIIISCGKKTSRMAAASENVAIANLNKTSTLAGNFVGDIVITTTKLNNNAFAGMGPQWGGYEKVPYWTGSSSLSTADWNKLFQRLNFMRPGLVRIMTGWGNYSSGGVYQPEKSKDILFKMLDYCQQKNINVMYGEWGEPAVNNAPNYNWLNESTNFLGYLLNTKNYSCIKYLNLLNEPAGSWSTIGGNYNLWQAHYDKIFADLKSKGLFTKLKVMLPDVAVWNDASLVDWITRPNQRYGNDAGAYDIHTYPTDDQTKGGSYWSTITAYRNAVPGNKQMIMGELGFKYAANSPKGIQNQQRIASDPYASDDSQMFVYDAFYGVDIADAIIQNINAGYNGVILWNLDDAMYDNGNNKLKRWGFWNILGAEKFGNANDENIRPWFFPVSLLCRYMPKDAYAYKANVPAQYGLKAIGASKGGKYTYIISNCSTTTYEINLKSQFNHVLSGTKLYCYRAFNGSNYEGARDTNGLPVPYSTETIDFTNNKGYPMTIVGNSVVVVTNMD